MKARLLVIAGSFLLLVPGVPHPIAPAAPVDKDLDFARDIYPILQRSCFECHGPEKQKGKLRLDSREGLLRGGRSGPPVVAGKADESDLYRRIVLPKGSKGIMPDRGEALSAEQAALVRRWIDQGSPWPETVRPARHWAYRKPAQPALPALKDAQWPKNPIDHFVLARLEKEGLRPSPEADRATLIRRVTLDLTGLPPMPAEVDAFLADRSADAYDKLVDRLLASPQFGPRWARPWLDLAHYADSHGFQRDDLRDLWAYRDWVIQALNRDMPFDRFTIEQLAGDLLPDASDEQKIATGFGRCAPTNCEAGSEPEETRVNQIIDRINTTAAIWLGTTLECAQCHNHKYDPFTQKEYYQLFAFFNSTAIEAERSNPKVPGSIRFVGPSMPLSGTGNQAERDRLAGMLADLDRQLKERRQTLAQDLPAWEAGLAKALKDAPRKHVLDVADFTSSAGAPHRVLDDKSILLVDDPPDKDTYTIAVRTRLRDISGFELEALTDPSLPGNGPGRGDAKRPNFVLNTFAVTAAPTGGAAQPRPVKFRDARASFSQKGYDVKGAIDDDPKTAWAINPEFHKSHWAQFEAEKPLGFEEGTTFTFTLVQQFGAGRTIGRLRLSALTGNLKARPLSAELVAILETPADKRSEAQARKLLDHRADEDAEASRLKEQRTKTDRELQALKPATTLVMRELPTPRQTSVFTRGDYRTPGDAVRAGTPAVLHKLADGAGNRLALARWLVDRDNPLAARVHANRLWAELFGRGLVSTVEDFGIKGEPPTHPELLDWLAVEFMDNGWSVKKLLRTMVTSATYRQSAKLTPELLARDDQNRLLARGSRFRMDAEMIRDNALAAAGLLSLKQGGPPVRPYQPEGLWNNKVGGERIEYIVSPGEDRYRRGIYVVWKRTSLYPSFVNFDATARLACTVKRSRSNTPLQALTLLNDPVYVEAALALAKRVLTDRPDASSDDRVRHAFRLCLAREPRDAELRVLRQLLEGQRERAKSDPKAAQALIGNFRIPDGCTAAEFAAWYAVATALLNLDETITKG
jgi:mono/diheme cytochrome c family protein